MLTYTNKLVVVEAENDTKFVLFPVIAIFEDYGQFELDG